jgi:glucan biosynthesis protein C
VAAPILAIGSTLMAMAADPGFNLARQYISELGGASARAPLIFNSGVFVAGMMAGLAGVGFGLAVTALTGARITGGLTAAVFILSGAGLIQSALHPWPDPRHLAINLALGIQLAPLFLLWGLWSRPDVRRLKQFLAISFAAMAGLTVLTRHLILPGLVNDANVGWWERAYAIILVGWVGVAALALDRCLQRQAGATRTA